MQIQLAYQSYLDRGLSADGPELVGLMGRAFAARNDLMARALLEAAFTSANAAAMDEYIRHDPSSGEKVRRLIAITRRNRAPGTRLLRAIEFSLGPSWRSGGGVGPLTKPQAESVPVALAR